MTAPKEIWLRPFRFESRVVVVSNDRDEWQDNCLRKNASFIGPATKAIVHEDGRIEVVS